MELLEIRALNKAKMKAEQDIWNKEQAESIIYALSQGWYPGRNNVREYRQTTDDCDWID